MKKILLFSILLIASLFTIACSKTKTDKKPSKEGLLSVDELLAQTKESQLICDKYSLGKYMKNIWDTQIIYNETAMFFEDKDGTIKDKTLVYPIAKILEVRDNTLQTLYEEGKDYSVIDGKLHYLEGSRIHVTKYDDYYLDEPNNSNAVFSSVKEEGKYYVYSEGDYFTSKQVSITYIRTTEWEGPKVERNEEKLPNIMKKLENHEPINIVFYGDSIMSGCNSSGFNKVEPNMPIISKLITKSLINHFEYEEITEINTAVGGWTTNNGVVSDELNPRVIEKDPDLVVISFGANDATFQMDPNTYGQNLFNMMNKVNKSNPDCEFIIVSSPKPNADAVGSIGNMAGNIDDFKPILESLSEDEHVAFADMTTMSEYILSRKDWVDITANNINHPNDFMIRIFAQLVMSIFY